MVNGKWHGKDKTRNPESRIAIVIVLTCHPVFFSCLFSCSGSFVTWFWPSSQSPSLSLSFSLSFSLLHRHLALRVVSCERFEFPFGFRFRFWFSREEIKLNFTLLNEFTWTRNVNHSHLTFNTNKTWNILFAYRIYKSTRIPISIQKAERMSRYEEWDSR